MLWNTISKAPLFQIINPAYREQWFKNIIQYFYDKTGNRITFEYILFYDFNDSIEDAEKLLKYARRVPVRINIIEYNPIDGGEFKQAKAAKVDAFKDYLEERGVVINIRRSRGKDIDAACGQLANKK